MNALLLLTVANIKSFTRDRAALFWTLAFPLIFVVLFGSIFSGGTSQRTIGFADLDASAASERLKGAFASVTGVTVVDGSQDGLLEQMRSGEVSAVVVVPKGYADTVAAKAAPAQVTVYTDPSQSSADAGTRQLIGFVLAAVNQEATGQPPAVVPAFQAIQTNDLTFISYLVPSILGMSLMQLGVFSAVPLVADREKLILKRLNATPLQRWQLVGSNVVMRLLIAIFQTVIIVGVGSAAYHVEIAGSWLLIGALILLGSLAFIALGYVIASFAKSEEAANGMTSVVQFPLMFLSGTFFPRFLMPEWLQHVTAFLPLTPVIDGIRLIATEGKHLVDLLPQLGIIGVWMIIIYVIAFRVFRWE